MVFLSSTGFTLNAHLCGGDLKTIGVLQIGKKCGMHEAEQVPTCHKDASDDEEDGCCTEKAFEIEAQDKEATQQASLVKVFPTLYLIYELISFTFSDFLFGDEDYDLFSLSPPYKLSEIHILNQTFLI